MRNVIGLKETETFKFRVGYFNNDTWIYHNTEGPAKVYQDLESHWMIHNVLHRIDGPAVIVPKLKINKWYVNGELVPVKTQEAFIAWKNANLI